MKSYVDLKVWEKSIDLSCKVYEVTKPFPKEETYGITQQIRRDAVSVPSNIAEGSSRTTDKEFAHFITIARGSLSELHTQLIISHKVGYLDENQLNNIYINITEVSKMLNGLRKTLVLDKVA